ncbi:beta-galactosidase [soil metagenome]
MPLFLPVQAPSFQVVGREFRLDGRPFVIHSGEMHYARVPREYWRARMRLAKAMGLNTICTYVFWNQHEATEGQFDFKGNLDLAEYLKTAQEEGLMVILRPGPYVCTELDFGGYPAWLLKDPKTKVRSMDPTFRAAAGRYLDKVGTVVKPFLRRNGGPVIMAQVENEYGSYGDDHEYMRWVRDRIKGAGITCQLMTSDGPGEGSLKGGMVEGALATVNFGGGAAGSFGALEKLQPGKPRMIGEYWFGWFDHVGKRHHTTSVASQIEDLRWCLRNGVSFNLYMFHGGSNFGFMPGSNGGGDSYDLDTQSYDYDAPVDESGRPTEKFLAFRKLMEEETGTKLPPIPAVPAPITVPRFKLDAFAPLPKGAGNVVISTRLPSFEEMGQAYGMVSYTTTETGAGKQTLVLARLCDYAIVSVDGKRAGTLDRRKGQRSLEVDVPRDGAPLSLLVEVHSRVNFGGELPNERKGMFGPVTLGGKPLTQWTLEKYPLTDLKGLAFAPGSGGGVGFYRGSFTVSKPGDTFLDTKGWNKGYVWVNGRNLGRFWDIGPQRTMVLPAPWLKRGRNEVVVLDEGPSVASATMEGLAAPILDGGESDWARLHRKPGEKVVLEGLKPIYEGTLPDGEAWETLSVSGTGRYLVLETLEEQKGQPFATLAELRADGPSGEIDRKDWKIAFADSEEIDEDDGGAQNAIDNQPTTFWHTQWSNGQPKHPHYLVIDLGKSETLTTVRLLPRQTNVNGRLKRVRLYLADRLPVR